MRACMHECACIRYVTHTLMPLTYSRVPNKHIGQITVQGGKSVKCNNSIVLNNSIEGQIVQNK